MRRCGAGPEDLRTGDAKRTDTRHARVPHNGVAEGALKVGRGRTTRSRRHVLRRRRQPSSPSRARQRMGGPFAELVEATYRLIRAMMDCRVPTVARLNGHTVGLGATLALLADTRVVTADARIRLGHVAAGCPLDGGSSYALDRALGPARAMSLLVEDRPTRGTDLHRGVCARHPPTTMRERMPRCVLPRVPPVQIRPPSSPRETCCTRPRITTSRPNGRMR